MPELAAAATTPCTQTKEILMQRAQFRQCESPHCPFLPQKPVTLSWRDRHCRWGAAAGNRKEAIRGGGGRGNTKKTRIKLRKVMQETGNETKGREETE